MKDNGMVEKERWTHESEWEDCSLCFGTGLDSEELDGKCIYCDGVGETLQTTSTCNWCEESAFECECNADILNNAINVQPTTTGGE